MTQSLHSILLYVADFSRSLDYYRTILGQPEEFSTPEDGGVAVFRIGGAQLVIHSDQSLESDYLPLPGERGRGTLIHFQVADLEARERDLQAAGILISQGISEQPWGLRTLYLYDPDGYNIVLVQPS